MTNKIKEIFKNKKIRNIIIVLLVIIVVTFIIIFILNKRVANKDKNTTSYDEIVSMINNKDTFLIYYYNSKSKNKYNTEIKEYLDELGIKYFNYNDVLLKRKEYGEFLKLINIDKNDFGMPALIFIRGGKMYANIINIDNKEVVKKFIDNYDLYTVK